MSEQKIIKRALNILEARMQRPDYVVRHNEDAQSFLRLQMSELEHESFQVMFLNNQHGLIKLKELFRGTIDGASVYPREVVKATLQFNAAAVIFAHNHPSGKCEPSAADRHITQQLRDALSLIDVRVLDHIIIGDKETYSFAEHGLI
jgi:DNA repair protein RadC